MRPYPGSRAWKEPAGVFSLRTQRELSRKIAHQNERNDAQTQRRRVHAQRDVAHGGTITLKPNGEIYIALAIVHSRWGPRCLGGKFCARFVILHSHRSVVLL